MTASRPTALITGVAGQDGSYLAELLDGAGYRVIGTVRPGRTRPLPALPIFERVEILAEDFSDEASVRRVLEAHAPDEVYNLAARASSADLFADPSIVGDANGLLVARILESIRLVNPAIRFFQALSSELFGAPVEQPQSESTPFQPANPYAAAKLYGYWMVRIYRNHFGLHASSGILFNHESPRRDPHFVTRKVTRAAALIKQGRMKSVELGSLDARRDWSFAGDFARAMHLIVRHSEPDDYVLASGETHSVADLCEAAFSRVGLDYRNHVIEAQSLKRSADPVLRVGNPEKARSALSWRPSVDFKGLVDMMVDADMTLAKAEGQ